jgi:hypothetical protein
VLEEFYRVAFRKKLYSGIAALQLDLDEWIRAYNEERPHQGRWCFGKTPMETFLDAQALAKEKLNAARFPCRALSSPFTPRREPLKCAQEDLSWRRHHRECNRFRSGSPYPAL